MATRRMTMWEAADSLGVSKEAIRKRVVRGTLPSEVGEDGRRYVYIEAGRAVAAAKVPTREHDVQTHTRRAYSQPKSKYARRKRPRKIREQRLRKEAGSK